jgi:hypothetical protein
LVVTLVAQNEVVAVTEAVAAAWVFAAVKMILAT